MNNKLGFPPSVEFSNWARQTRASQEEFSCSQETKETRLKRVSHKPTGPEHQSRTYLTTAEEEIPEQDAQEASRVHVVSELRILGCVSQAVLIRSSCVSGALSVHSPEAQLRNLLTK